MISITELVESIIAEKSKVADAASKLGLKYMSFGRWGKDGKVTHKSIKGRLVAVTPHKPSVKTKSIVSQHSDKTIMKKRVGPQKGSNPGGTFVGTDGKKRYVKRYKNADQAAGEQLANTIYQALGFKTPNSLVYGDGKGITYASEIIPNTKELGYDYSKQQARKILHGFAADILVANWDVVGLENDNIVYQAGSDEPIRVDNGAAFLTRAQGAYKPAEVLNKVTEYEGFQDVNINPAYAELFKRAGYSEKEWNAEFKQQVNHITTLVKKFGSWDKFIEEFNRTHLSSNIPPKVFKSQKAILSMLNTRLKALQKLAK